MVEVPVREPRFLGEKVPYREQTMQENLQSNLPGYTITEEGGVFVARAKPVQYVSERRGANRTYAEYVPNEIVISPTGEVLKETKRATYKTDVFEHGQRQDVYESEVTDYQSQTRRTYGKRDLRSGRETIQLTSELSGGVYRENRIIDQDTKEYEIAKAQHDLFQGFVNQGMSYAQARQLSRTSEQQREAYFKQVAQQRTQQFSLQGKAVTLKHQAQRQFQTEYYAQRQQYAENIVRKQEEARQKPPVLEKPKVVSQFQPPNITPQNPASPTTRTDMGTQFILPTQKQSATMTKKPEFMTSSPVATEEQARRQQQLASDNIVQKQIDKAMFGVQGMTEKGTEWVGSKNIPLVSPLATEVVAPAVIGGAGIFYGTIAHPVQAVKSMLDPIGTAQSIAKHQAELTATKGEIYSLSYFGGQIGGGYLLGKASERGVELAKDVYVKTGSKYREPETVFAPETLSGEKTFFTVRSTAESLAEFNKAGKSYDIGVVQEVAKNPEAFVKPTVQGHVAVIHPVLQELRATIPPEDLVFTGGVARRILTGEGKVRDVDVVVKDVAEGKDFAYRMVSKYPEKYEAILHEKYPEIYRLRERKTGEVKVDFDPRSLAEEGMIKKKEDIIRVGEYNVVSPSVMLKSKATQILKGKTRGLKQGENIQQLNPEIPIFEDKVVVSTASPTGLKGKTVTAQIEKIGLEDTGIYVAPKGKVSPYFTGIEPPTTTYSLNPFVNFGVPSVTEFAINKVTTYPKEVLVKPGFEHLTGYQQANVGKGLAYITKRSMIGTGDLPRQRFYLGKQTTMTGKTVEPGWRMEAGTSEGEAVIGVGESFAMTPKTFLGKIKGFEEYTTYKGRAVAVRQGKVLAGTTLGGVPEGSVVIPGSKVKAGQEALGSLARGEKVVTPLSSAKAIPVGSFDIQEELGRVSSRMSNLKTRPLVFSSEPVESSKSVEVSSGVSKTKLRESVASSSQSMKSSIRIPGGISRRVSKEQSRVGSFLSGRSYGGSSGESGRSGKSGGSSAGGTSRGGGSTGTSYGAGQDIPRKFPKVYPKPSEEKRKGEKFRVEVRKKGQFRTIAITETPQEAFRIGKQNVLLTASASLRVKPVQSQEKVTNIGKSMLPISTFYESKKEPDVFIQRREKRISTYGEKSEITFRGIQATRKKGIFGG